MLQIIFTTALIVLYYVCSIGIYYNVNGLKIETIRNGQKDVIVICKAYKKVAPTSKWHEV